MLLRNNLTHCVSIRLDKHPDIAQEHDKNHTSIIQSTAFD